jgi:hypothetical protein
VMVIRCHSRGVLVLGGAEGRLAYRARLLELKGTRNEKKAQASRTGAAQVGMARCMRYTLCEHRLTQDRERVQKCAYRKGAEVPNDV